MKIEKTPLVDCYIIHDTVYGDQRGYFFESFNRKTFFSETGMDVDFVQDNQSKSQKGVLRGLHFQEGEHVQAKLVRVLQGKVLDVVVDLRKKSPSYGQSFSMELTEDNHQQLFVPKGFAHGFVVLSETAVFFYKCDNYYNKASERGIIFNDKDLAIDWQLSDTNLILSDKDQVLPTFQEISNSLNF